jgi:hypothetical protein
MKNRPKVNAMEKIRKNEDAQIREKVFRQVRHGLQDLVGGSGHLASLHILEPSFRIAAVEKLPGGLTEYYFTALAHRESEFTIAREDQPEPPPERIRGSIVLDAHFQLTRDDRGNIRLQPWRTWGPLQSEGPLRRRRS